MNKIQSEELSIKVYEAWERKPEFNRPAEFCDLLRSIAARNGLYAVYAKPEQHGLFKSKQYRHDPRHFVRFLTRDQLFDCDFPKPIWKRTSGNGVFPRGKGFDMEFVDVYADFPKCAVHEITGRFDAKRGVYEYTVAFFRDGHISHQGKTSRRPLNLKALVEELRKVDMGNTYYDGTWAY